MKGALYYSLEKNYKSDEMIKDKISKYNNIYLRPTNQNSESYDSIYLKKKINNKYDGCLFQMTIKRKKEKILSRNEHLEKIKKIKDKMKKVYDIKIENIYLKYVFHDPKVNENEVRICKEKNLDYFFMNSNLDFIAYDENGKLYKMNNLDLDDNSLISKDFIDYDKYLIPEKDKELLFSQNTNVTNILKEKTERKNFEVISIPKNNVNKEKSIFGFNINVLEKHFPGKKLIRLKAYNCSYSLYTMYQLTKWKKDSIILVLKYNNKIYAVYDLSIYYVYMEKKNEFILFDKTKSKKNFFEKNLDKEIIYELFGGTHEGMVEMFLITYRY